jgi:hypothetical protein
MFLVLIFSPPPFSTRDFNDLTLIQPNPILSLRAPTDPFTLQFTNPTRVSREALTWYTNPKSRMTADRLENAAIGGLIRKFRPEEIHRYQNFDRSSPIENRYMGAKRINKLRALKKKYDPKGLFTKIFL